MTVWDVTSNEISIKQGGKTPGCVLVGLFIFGTGIIAVGVAIYLDAIKIEALNDTLPVTVFVVIFGFFWLLGAVSSRGNNPEAKAVIDSTKQLVRYRSSVEGSDIVIPFADLKSVIIHLKITTETRSESVHSGASTRSRTYTTYTYRIYLQKKDGAIFWLYTFTDKDMALEHASLLLERIEISCIDEAGLDLARTVDSTYTDASSRTVPGKVSSFVDVKDRGGNAVSIMLRYEQYGLRGIITSIFLLGLFVGCPIWFYFANQPTIPGWFFIIPGVFLFFALIAVFIRGRRYSLNCGSDRIEAHVRFWFPPFQWLFGKTVSIPATALKAVRVNRYDGGNFHLEIAVDKELKLPRIAGAAFNTGSVRMLPKSVTEDDLRTIGLWSVYQLTNQTPGPKINDLYAIEEMIQKTYGLDVSTA